MWSRLQPTPHQTATHPATILSTPQDRRRKGHLALSTRGSTGPRSHPGSPGRPGLIEPWPIRPRRTDIPTSVCVHPRNVQDLNTVDGAAAAGYTQSQSGSQEDGNDLPGGPELGWRDAVVKPYVVYFRLKPPGNKNLAAVKQYRLYATSAAEARRLAVRYSNYPHIEIISVKPA